MLLLTILIVIAVLVLALVAFDRFAPYPAARIALKLERLRCGLVAKKTSIPGFEIAYLEGGKGEPLLLIHGFGGDKDHFTRVSAKLTRRYHVVIPDLPGFGESSRPDGATYSIDEQVDRLRALAHKLGLSRFHLGGNSMGGGIALAYAVKYPEEVESLWLLAPAATRKSLDSELMRNLDEMGVNYLIMRSRAEYDRTKAFVMSRNPWMPGSLDHVLAERAIADSELHNHIFQEIRKDIVEDPPVQIEIPALLVWGKEDRVLNPGSADQLMSAMPNARLILMDGIGHIPMVEAPGQAARDYLEFRKAVDDEAGH